MNLLVFVKISWKDTAQGVTKYDSKLFFFLIHVHFLFQNYIKGRNFG